jgi:hypothetical protein
LEAAQPGSQPDLRKKAAQAGDFHVRHPTQEARRMKVKIFSVRADQDFRAIRIGDDTGRISPNEYLG